MSKHFKATPEDTRYTRELDQAVKVPVGVRTGVVKFYDAEKNYGFVFDDETGLQAFFHSGEIVGTYHPVKGDHVKFLVVNDGSRRSATATAVRPI